MQFATQPNTEFNAKRIEDGERLDVRLNAIYYGARDINFFELRACDGRDLPSFTAGSHIDVYLAKGITRQYSIASSVSDRGRYLLGVKLNANGRGGSRALHETWRVGNIVKIGKPRNSFPLDESASQSVFIAGGIGITPIFCMIERLHSLNRDWLLYYAVGHREEAALFERLPSQGSKILHVDSDNAGRKLDVAAVVSAAPEEAHLYCCGPSPMLDAFEAASAGRHADRVHLERFAAAEGVAAPGAGYLVELARSKRGVFVEQGQSLLKALQKAGVSVNVSCEQGICGTCETRVLAGIPDHRDSILSDDEKASNTSIMICCSGSLSPTLVLDL